MHLWQVEAEQKLIEFLSNFAEIHQIKPKGSILDKSTLDIYSDVDFDIYLASDSAFDLINLMKMLSQQFGTIFGYEIHNNSNSDVLRICFENGWRFDLTFIYPTQKTLHATDDLPEIEKVVSQFWFVTSMTLTKLGRMDYLTAAHLTLGLCQVNIVVQMLARDEAKNTNIHRFGDKEDVPILHDLLQLNKGNMSEKILSILFLAAEHVDRTMRTDKLRILQNMFDIK